MNSSMDVPSAEECYKVDRIIKHEGFVYEQDNSDITNDIALVHLAERVNITREISPICLPRAGAVMPAGTPCFVTGWGDEKGGKERKRALFPALRELYSQLAESNVWASFQGNLFPIVADKLNQAALPIIDFETCSKPTYWWETLRPSMVCAGYGSPDELKSACQVRKHIQNINK